MTDASVEKVLVEAGQPLTLQEIQSRTLQEDATMESIQRIVGSLRERQRVVRVCLANGTPLYYMRESLPNDKSAPVNNETTPSAKTTVDVPSDPCAAIEACESAPDDQKKTSNAIPKETTAPATDVVTDPCASTEARIAAVDLEIAALEEDYSIAELDEHITALHEYNEIKDAGQAVMGRLAELSGTTTKDMYKEFEMDQDD